MFGRRAVCLAQVVRFFLEAAIDAVDAEENIRRNPDAGRGRIFVNAMFVKKSRFSFQCFDTHAAFVHQKYSQDISSGCRVA